MAVLRVTVDRDGGSRLVLPSMSDWEGLMGFPEHPLPSPSPGAHSGTGGSECPSPGVWGSQGETLPRALGIFYLNDFKVFEERFL